MEKEEMLKIIKDNIRSQIALDIKDNSKGVSVSSSKIGGNPSVPAGFEWPTYHAGWFEEDEYVPLTFFAQFNMEELAQYDKDGIFPKKGMLSFFYCVTDEDLFYGTDPRDKGSARVFYFEDIESLVPAEFPEELSEEFRISEKAVSFKEGTSYPTSEVLFDRYEGFNWDDYHECMEENGFFDDEDYCTQKLLGHADYVQHCAEYYCEMLHRGLDATFPDGQVITKEDEKAMYGEVENWVQLLQIDPGSSEYDDVICVDGNIHFFIKKEDLKALDFEKIQYIAECS